MHKNLKRIIGPMFLGFGILMILIGVGIGVEDTITRNNFATNAYSVNAVIVDIVQWVDFEGDLRGRAYVNFDSGGINITAPLNHWTSSMVIGQIHELLVDRNNPHNFRSAQSFIWITVLITTSLGLIFGAIGVVLTLQERRKKQIREWLFANGVSVWADVQGYEDDWSIVVNGRPATVLVAEYETMRFVSEPLCNNDMRNIRDKVRLILHPNDFNIYTFDLR